LVIGAGGQVGLDVLARLRAAGDDVHAADLRAHDDEPGVAWHTVDVRSAEACRALIQRVRPGRVIHLAAILSARGEVDPMMTYAVNQTGLLNVLEAARAMDGEAGGMPQVIFTSTIAVFGPGLQSPVADAVALEPTTMYGVTKVAGELLGAYYHRHWGLDFRGVRFPGLISATPPGGGSSDYALYFFFEGIRSGRYAAFCRPDTRIPFMAMDDAVRALLELSDAPGDGLTRRVYNIAAFSPTAQQLADAVAAELGGADFTFEPDPVRQAILDSWPDALDDSLARRDWGWENRIDLPTLARSMIAEVRAIMANDPDSIPLPH
jgi:threonine 3-dehydrogenase